MTPPDLPLDDDAPLDDDTLAVHAVVDDEATADQRRRVARDPELVARVTVLRAVAAAVAEPVEPPPADVLASLRRRALDALDEPAIEPDASPGPEDAPVADDEPASDPPLPIRDLAAARTRRRSLPPLPAVAAVVVLMVVVGVGLLLAGTSGEESADQSSADAGAEVASDSGGEGDSAGASEAPTDGAGDDEALDEAFGERPADATRDALLAQATARYPTQAALERDLRLVDVETYALARTAPSAPDQEAGEASTTAPATGSSGTGAEDGTDAAAFAADPIATRCDDVLRAAEPDLEPAVAALLVSVQGEPVLVLSNPTEVTERSPEGLRLTLLNAVDCSPRSAIVR